MRLAMFHLLDNFIDFRIGRAQAGDQRITLLNQAEQWNSRKIGGEADVQGHFGLMLFRWVDLRKTRAKNVCLPEIRLRGHGGLFDVEIDEPDFRAIILRRVADQNDFEKRFVWLEINFVMKLGDERAEAFEKGDADLLEILVDVGAGIVGIGSSQAGNVVIEANGFGLRGHLPFGGAKENADVTIVNGGDARRNGFGLEGMIDGSKEDGVVGDLDYGAPAGEIGDDFVFLGADRGDGEESGQQNERGGSENGLHRGRVA